jgi:hypothetical protein
MKKTLIAAVAALALPVSVAAAEDSTTPSPREAAMATCKTQRAEIGKTAFKALYGANGYGRCVNKTTKTEQANASEARTDCKAEQADANFAAGHDGKTFDQFYGTNKNGKNAYGKCVSGKAKAASKEDTKTIVNAAKTCKKQRSEDPAGFAQWGGKKNAFGKCVSATAKAQNDDEETTS